MEQSKKTWLRADTFSPFIQTTAIISSHAEPLCMLAISWLSAAGSLMSAWSWNLGLDQPQGNYRHTLAVSCQYLSADEDPFGQSRIDSVFYPEWELTDDLNTLYLSLLLFLISTASPASEHTGSNQSLIHFNGKIRWFVWAALVSYVWFLSPGVHCMFSQIRPCGLHLLHT